MRYSINGDSAQNLKQGLTLGGFCVHHLKNIQQVTGLSWSTLMYGDTNLFSLILSSFPPISTRGQLLTISKNMCCTSPTPWTGSLLALNTNVYLCYKLKWTIPDSSVCTTEINIVTFTIRRRSQLLPTYGYMKMNTICHWKKINILPRPGIEPGTFRSSVWRSPSWAISALLAVWSAPYSSGETIGVVPVWTNFSIQKGNIVTAKPEV